MGMAATDTLNQRWMDEINISRKREKDFRKEGYDILKIYNGMMRDTIPFNILFSNTETMLPAVYNNTPRPVVQRRFKDEDALGKLSAKSAQRLAEFVLDPNNDKYSSFDSTVTDAIMDALLPGRGVTLVKYDAEIQEADKTANTIPIVKYEAVCLESIPWDRVAFGYAKNWSKVPWMAVYYEVDREEADKLFDKGIVAKMTFAPRPTRETEDDADAGRGEEKLDETKVACIWKVWSKKKKKIYFVSQSAFDGEVLKEDEDNLELQGFFPVTEPLRFIRKSNDQMPTALYKLYENQAKELNRITVRINRIIAFMKVRGVYNSALQEIERLKDADDGVMIPAENSAALENGNLNTAFWMVPIEKLIPVVNELLAARAQCKQTIYEITGISDILRGQTNAQETLGAQKIKENWATLRLKRVQREVQRYCRDLIRMIVEVAATKFSEETWASMTGMGFPTAAAKAEAQKIVALSPQAGVEPDPKAVAMAQSPSWAEIIGLLKDDTQRNYRIDIETNSTVDVEATEDQKNIAEVMNAISQFLHGMAPLIESGVMPFEAAQAMLLGIVRRYRFGSEVEDEIKAMKPPQPKEDPKDKIALQVAQMEAQAREKEITMEGEAKQAEHGYKLKELAAKAQYAELMAKIKLREAQNKLQMMEKEAQIRVAEAHAMPKDKENTNAPA